MRSKRSQWKLELQYSASSSVIKLETAEHEVHSGMKSFSNTSELDETIACHLIPYD